jgi:hypothetical protein
MQVTSITLFIDAKLFRVTIFEISLMLKLHPDLSGVVYVYLRPEAFARHHVNHSFLLFLSSPSYPTYTHLRLAGQTLPN